MTTTLELFEHRTEALSEQLASLADHPFYEDHAKDVDLSSVSTLETFAELPFTETADFAADFETDPPFGSHHSGDIVQMNLTPTGDSLMPEFNTDDDLDRMASALGDQFERAGLGPDDVVLQCLGYELFVGGWAMHLGLQAAGVTVLPFGPGDSEQAADLVRRFEATGVVANPSFGRKIAEQGEVELDLFVGAGEPFTSVPGKREEVRAAFVGDPTVVDLFGLSEAIPVAAECRHENGLHVADDYVLVEVIDPETGEHIAPGERGEAVLTHLKKDAMPLVRYRTGDLTTLIESTCECGRSLTLPAGVFGRVDNRLKVKGIKFYPESIRPVLARFPGLTGEFTVELSRSSGTDAVDIRCRAEYPGAVSVSELSKALAEELLLTPDTVEVETELQTDQQVVDTRYE